MLTRIQIYNLVRANIGDKSKLEPTLVNQYINHSLVKVLVDLMGLGIKRFTKTVLLEGAYVATPSDMIALANAIISLKATSGVRASGVATFSSSKFLHFEFQESGTVGNGWNVLLIQDAGLASPYTPYVDSYDTGTGKFISIHLKSGSTTVAQMVSLFATHQILKNLFLISSDETGALTFPSMTDTSVALANGAGTGWLPTREYSIEEFEELGNNEYVETSSSFIGYVRNGDTEGNQQIAFSPNSVLYSRLVYYCLLPSMDSDSSTSGLPAEFEELLVIDVQAKCFEKLKMIELVPDKKQHYEQAQTGLERAYISLLDKRRGDKARLVSQNPND